MIFLLLLAELNPENKKEETTQPFSINTMSHTLKTAESSRTVSRTPLDNFNPDYLEKLEERTQTSGSRNFSKEYKVYFRPELRSGLLV